MRVQPEASILHFLHYSHFRDKGLAYELRECEYSEVWYSARFLSFEAKFNHARAIIL